MPYPNPGETVLLDKFLAIERDKSSSTSGNLLIDRLRYTAEPPKINHKSRNLLECDSTIAFPEQKSSNRNQDKPSYDPSNASSKHTLPDKNKYRV